MLHARTVSTLGFSEDDVRTAFVRCDRNGDGKLDFDDFLQLFTVAWAHREKRVAFQDSFARDMSEVVSQACQPVMPPVPGEEVEYERVSTSFPFVLVANQHRISKLIDESGAPAARVKMEKEKQDSVKRLTRQTSSVQVKKPSVPHEPAEPLPGLAGAFRRKSQVPHAKKIKIVVPEAQPTNADILAFTESPKLPKLDSKARR